MTEVWYPELYKLDSKGKLRVWFMEREGHHYRTYSGLFDGKRAVTGWTEAKATNVGRSNERNPEAQAIFEIEAEYEHNLTRDYHKTPEGAKGGAHFFEPMLAAKYSKFAPGFAQPKLDGIRCITKADGMWSRQGKPIGGAPHIMEALAPVFKEHPNVIFDGELYNHDLRDDFNKIVSIVKKQDPDAEQLEESRRICQYHVYDMPSDDAVFGQRFWGIQAINRMHKLLGGPIHLVETVEVTSAEAYDEHHGRWMEEGYEGSMWRADAPYEQKRSKTLQKRKEFQDDEFELIRIEEGNGNWAGVAKRAVCRLPDGREFGAGIKGTRERAAELLHEDHKVVTIQYFALTPDGIPRFPVATKFHGAKRTL